MDPAGKLWLRGGRNGIEVSQTERMTRPPRAGQQRSKETNSIDGRVPQEFQRPVAGQPDLTVLDRINMFHGDMGLDVLGNEKGGLEVRVTASLQMSLDTKAMMVSALAALPTDDFGYIFFADEFTWHKDSGKEYRVMAVLNCGFLRLFQWPLRSDSMRRLEMNKGQAQYSLVDMKKAPSFQEARPGHPPCILLTRVKAGLLFGEKAVTEGLCATGGKAEALFRALQQQMQRFQDSHAKQWSYGTHPAAKPQYVLPTGTAQMNLLEVLNGFTWSEFRPDVTSHPVHNPVLLQVSKDSQDGVGSEEALVKSSRPGKTAKPTKTPKAPSKTGSFEAKACRAQEDLNTHRYPPEDYGNASVRLVFPATPIGDVHLLIQKIQVVQFDIVGELVRNSDTTFLFEITGKEGPGTAFAYVEGHPLPLHELVVVWVIVSMHLAAANLHCLTDVSLRNV